MHGLRLQMNDALLELAYDDPLNAWGDLPVLELSGPLDGRLDAVLAALEAHVWPGALPSPGGWPGSSSVRSRRRRVVHALAYPGGDALGGRGGGELAGVAAGLDVRPQPGGEPLVPVDRVLGGGAAPGGPATEPAGENSVRAVGRAEADGSDELAAPESVTWALRLFVVVSAFVRLFRTSSHHSPFYSKYADDTGSSKIFTLSYSKNNLYSERMWLMSPVPAPADPGWGEDPAWPDRDPVRPEDREAWLDRLCELDDDPFDDPRSTGTPNPARRRPAKTS